ncbi:MAG: hypothetical protein K2J11_08915, partial [Oscillospiraceae bacterium]|nr:hypothetical protein [Oscillospiraceae bacterium]
QQGGAVVFAPPRNGSRRFSPPAPFRGNAPAGAGGDFAACGRRPKGSSPFGNLASWAQLDQL